MEKTELIAKLKDFIKDELEGDIENLKCFYFGKIVNNTDADSLPIVIAIYEILWGDKLQIEDCYSGDTINTFATLLGRDLEKELMDLNIQESSDNLPQMTVGNINLNDEMKSLVYQFNRTFLTIGNFMPLPTKKPVDFNNTINQYRGSTNGYRDYFDKFLYELKKCFLADNYDENLYKIFRANEKYFDSFGKGEAGFLQYCNEYFLDNYIDSSTGEVINYFEVNRHWVEGKNLSKEEYTADIKNYIDRVTEIINSRAEKIIIRLKDVLNEQNPS